MNSKLHQAYLNAKEKFIQYDGILGVGYGTKITRGKAINNESIIVFVENKLPAKNVKKEQLIPATFEGFPVDVRIPKLNMTSTEKFDPNKPPQNHEDECLFDYNWIDFEKIHRLNLERLRKKKQGINEIGDIADAPTIDTVGNLFVIHDPTGSLVVAGTIDWIGAYNLFRGTFGDNYDFVSFFVDANSGMPNTGNASNHIFNNINGIAVGAINNRASWGSTKLLHHIHHSWFSLRTLLHEPAHCWLLYVNYRLSAMGAKQTLFHQDFTVTGQENFHWGRWPDDNFDCMDYDRADWINNGDGTYNWVRHFEDTEPLYFGYSPLDLHLMGLIPPGEVPNFDIVQNPTPAISDATVGPYTPTGGAVNIGISNVQFEEGIRNPDYLNSQRVFHQAVIIITKDAGTATTFITDSESWRTQHTANFRRATGGRAMIDTSLLQTNYADLYSKDNNTDTGTGITSAPFWLSPDLWVRNVDDNGTTHQDTIRGASNWIYARVRNKGAQSYVNVIINFYLSNFAGTEFLYPNDWNNDNLLGSATLVNVPAASGGVDGEAIAKIEWIAVKIPPAAGWHPCLLCEIIPMETAPSGLHHVWENKKLTQRNITIIDAPHDSQKDIKAFMFEYDFRIGNLAKPKHLTKLKLFADESTSAGNIMFFLDPGNLVKELESVASENNFSLPIQINKNSSGIPHSIDEINMDKVNKDLKKKYDISGTSIYIPKGTEIAILPDCSAKVNECSIWLKFCSETIIKAGYKKQELLGNYQLNGLVPTMINNIPLLYIRDLSKAEVMLNLSEGQIENLRIIGIVSPYTKTGREFLYHIAEEDSNGNIIGGISIQINL